MFLVSLEAYLVVKKNREHQEDSPEDLTEEGDHQ
jgi:hypothetical protein